MFSTSSTIGDGLHIIFAFNLWWKEFIMLSSNVRKVPGLSTSLNLWFTASISVTTLCQGVHLLIVKEVLLYLQSSDNSLCIHNSF